jgi:hypothetical protein
MRNKMVEPASVPWEISGATIIWSPKDKQIVASVSEPEPLGNTVKHEEVQISSPHFYKACTNAVLIRNAANFHEKLVTVLEACAGAIEEEVAADCGDCHPVVMRHKKVADKARKLLAEIKALGKK